MHSSPGGIWPRTSAKTPKRFRRPFRHSSMTGSPAVASISTCGQRHPMAPETDTARRPSSSTERMRLYRRRRQHQLRSIRVVLTAGEINALIERGYLNPDSRNDSRAIGYAAMAFISDSPSGI
jgi:hypothetical protein